MRRSLLIAVTLLTLVPGIGRADHIAVGPPFAEEYYYSECPTVVVGTCEADAAADGATGDLDMLAALGSPPGGIPGVGSVYGYAGVAQSRILNQPIPGADINVTVHVDRATASREGALPGDRGWAYTYLAAYVYSETCFCFGDAFLYLADADGIEAPTEVEDQDVTLSLRLQNFDGGMVTPGRAWLVVETYGDASLGGSFIAPLPDTGTAGYEVDATVTSATAHVS